NTSPLRRLSGSSQFSSFSPTNETSQTNGEYSSTSLPSFAAMKHNLPPSPTKAGFFTASAPVENPKCSPSSPLRSSRMITRATSPPLLPPLQFPLPSRDTTSSSSSSTNPETPELSDASEDESPANSLLPPNTELENSARVNRKVSP